MKFPVDALKAWFLDNRRDLPWRIQRTPYHVWVSEVMLQQTQVSVVIPYFLRWMEHFPTIEALANAPLDKVIKLWEGLGYYSRAKRLHEGAKTILEHFGGYFPKEIEQMKMIKGLGPYTLGAVASFAFGYKMPAIDGNVMRVLTRFFGIVDEVEKQATKKRIYELASEMLPDEDPYLITEGLIELGALICKKDPRCFECPLRSSCVAYRDQLQHELPNKKKRVETTILHRLVGVVFHGKECLLHQAEEGKVMSSLYEFPFLNMEEVPSHPDKVVQHFEAALGMNLTYKTSLPMQKHSFTRYRVFLYPHCFLASHKTQGIWKKSLELTTYPFSSGHRKVLHSLQELL